MRRARRSGEPRGGGEGGGVWRVVEVRGREQYQFSTSLLRSGLPVWKVGFSGCRQWGKGGEDIGGQAELFPERRYG